MPEFAAEGKGMMNEAKRIVTALKECAGGACHKCAYDGDYDCQPMMLKDAADMIEQMAEEIDQLKRECNARL